MSWLLALRDLIWGPPLLLFILGTGLFLTIRLRGVQLRYLPYAIRLLFSRHSSRLPGDISPFQSLMTSLAATIGIGSIAGVAIALTTGGIGALVWMVIASLIGMATIYSEAFLAVKFRTTDENGEMSGGPMYTLSRGLKSKWLGAVFGGAGAFAALSTGNMIQANSIADVATEIFPVSRWVVGTVTALLIAIVLLGGIKKIGKVAGYLVPLMASLYIGGGAVILLMRIDVLPAAVFAMVSAAFTGKAVLGGAAGTSVLMALRMGVSRGILASEAGLGTPSIAAAAAKTDQPGRQALISMTGAFLSVCVVCMITGLVIVVSGVLGNGQNGVPLTASAFNAVLPGAGYVVMVGAILFGYSTILGWAYYGEKCAEYVFGSRSISLYRVFYTFCIILGAMLQLDVVWGLADVSNAFMIVPNLIGVLGLSGLVAAETRPYLKGVGFIQRVAVPE